MALTLRANSVTGGTVAGRELTYAEVDANWDYATLASSQRFTPSGTGATSRTVQDKLRETVTVTDFGAIGDGVTDDTTAIQNAFNSGAKRIHFPKGSYIVTARLKAFTTGNWEVTGDGKNVSVIVLGGNLSSSLFDISGTDKNNHISYFTFADFAVSGVSRAYTGDIFTLASASLCTWRGVLISGVDGHAIKATELWDSCLINTNIESCGNVAGTKESLRFTCANTADSATGSNNIAFFDCKIESNYYTAMLWDKYSRKMRFIGSKIHGLLPTPAAYPHLKLLGAYTNMIAGCSFQNGGDASISIDVSGAQASSGNVIVGNIIDGSATWGVDIVSGASTTITGNTFGFSAGNTSGSARVQAGANNTFTANTSTDSTVISGSFDSVDFGAHSVKTQSSGQVVLHKLISNPATGAAFDNPTYEVDVTDSAGSVVTGAQMTHPMQVATAGAVTVDILRNVRKAGTLTTFERVLGASGTIRSSFGRSETKTSTTSSSGAVTFSKGFNYHVMTENITGITMPSSPDDGEEIAIQFKQSAGGGNTVAGWPATVLLAGGAFTLTATASKTDTLAFKYNSTLLKWIEKTRAQNC